MKSETTFEDLKNCFTGMIPMVLATVSASGVPNITYMSKAHPIGDDRIAVSNQFMSKSNRNLAENPYADILMLDTVTFDEYRLAVRFERTEKRGPIFDRLRNDLSLIAALSNMEGVFKLKAADIFYVESIEKLPTNDLPKPVYDANEAHSPSTVAELCARISRGRDLDSLVRMTLDSMAELLNYEHSTLLLVDEAGTGLFTLASHGYDSEGIDLKFPSAKVSPAWRQRSVHPSVSATFDR